MSDLEMAKEILSLREKAEAQGRGLDPKEVLDWSRRHRESELHRRLFVEPSEGELADEARLARIRGYIRVHVTIIERERRVLRVTPIVKPAHELYSPRSLRGGGSYVSRKEALQRYRGDVLSDGVSHLREFNRKWGDLEEFSEIAQHIRAWLDRAEEGEEAAS